MINGEVSGAPTPSPDQNHVKGELRDRQASHSHNREQTPKWLGALRPVLTDSPSVQVEPRRIQASAVQASVQFTCSAVRCWYGGHRLTGWDVAGGHDAGPGWWARVVTSCAGLERAPARQEVTLDGSGQVL